MFEHLFWYGIGRIYFAFVMVYNTVDFFLSQQNPSIRLLHYYFQVASLVQFTTLETQHLVKVSVNQENKISTDIVIHYFEGQIKAVISISKYLKSDVYFRNKFIVKYFLQQINVTLQVVNWFQFATYKWSSVNDRV